MGDIKVVAQEAKAACAGLDSPEKKQACQKAIDECAAAAGRGASSFRIVAPGSAKIDVETAEGCIAGASRAARLFGAGVKAEGIYGGTPRYARRSRCVPIDVNEMNWGLRDAMHKLSSSAGDGGRLETCDTEVRYGMTPEFATKLFSGKPDQILETLRVFDKQKLAEPDSRAAKGYSRRIEKIYDQYKESSAIRALEKWQKDDNEKLSSEFKAFDKSLGEVASKYSEAKGRIDKAALSSREKKTDEAKRELIAAVDEFKQWLEAQAKEVKSIVESKSGSIEVRAKAMDMAMELQQALMGLGMDVQTSVMDSAIGSAASSIDSAIDSTTRATGLAIDLVKTRGDLGVEIIGGNNAVLASLAGEVIRVLGEDLVFALGDAKRLIDGELKPATLAGYESILRVLALESKSALARASTEFPKILERHAVERDQMFAEWRGKSEAALKSAGEAGAAYESKSGAELADSEKRAADGLGRQKARMTAYIDEKKKRIGSMLAELTAVAKKN